MSDGRLRLEASANFSRLNAAFERQKEKTAKLEEEVRRLGQGHDRMGKKGQNAFEGMARYAKTVVSSYVGVHAAVAAVNMAIQEEIDLRRKASESNKSLQEERLSFLTQTAQFTPEQRSRFESRIYAAAQAAGITEAEALALGSRALTATSDSDVDVRIEKAAGIVEKMAFYGPTLRGIEGLPGAILDLQRTIGGTQENAIGFALAARSTSRLEDDAELPNFIRTVAGAAAIQTGVENKMDLAKQTLALFSAFQAVTGDVIGANTSTAITNFIAALQRENGDRSLTPDQLINALQDEEGIKFIGKSFSKPVQEDLIRSGSEITKIYRDALKTVEQDFGLGYQKMKSVMSGEGDAALTAYRQSEGAQAEVDKWNRELRGVDAEAMSIVNKYAPLANPGLGRLGLRRMAEVYKMSWGADLDDTITYARQALAEKVSRGDGFFGALPDLNPLYQMARVQATMRKYSDAELLQMGDAEDDYELKASRSMLRRLLAIQKEQMAEESAERKADNAKLVDTVGKAINTSVGNARLTSEQEN